MVVRRVVTVSTTLQRRKAINGMISRPRTTTVQVTHPGKGRLTNKLSAKVKKALRIL